VEWLNLIEARHTTFAWDEELVPTKDTIEEAIKEVLTNIPSKNQQFPYQVRMLRNNNPEIRKEIFTICHRNADLQAEDDPGNPQVLAPWLLGFNARWCADTEVRYEKNSERGKVDGFGKGNLRTNDPSGHQAQTENIEIGLFSAYIMLALANRGIQSGMCQNVCNNYAMMTQIFKLAEDEKALDFRFIMGIGYGKDPNIRHDYLDPRVNKIKPIPFEPTKVDLAYPKPEYKEIVKWI